MGWKVTLAAQNEPCKESVGELRVKERGCSEHVKTNFTALPAWTCAKYTFSCCIRCTSIKAFVEMSRCLTSAFEKLSSTCACWQLSTWTQVCQTAPHTLWASSLMGMRLRIQGLSKNLVSFVPFIWKFWGDDKSRFKRSIPTTAYLLSQLM